MSRETPITLLGRSIPVVATDDELLRLQQAAQVVEEKVRVYKQQYGLTDEGYLLRMACLELATAQLADRTAAEAREAAVAEQIRALEQSLAADLSALGLLR
jgi:cell division protein ZapA (FtsZ GTPase activity inhibitor)